MSSNGSYTMKFENPTNAKTLVLDSKLPDTLENMPWFEKVVLVNIKGKDIEKLRPELEKYFIRQSDSEYTPKKEFFRNGHLAVLNEIQESMPEWSRISKKMR